MCRGDEKCKLLVGKSEERRPFGRHKHKWDDYTKINLQ
jgi:hypothetical protein